MSEWERLVHAMPYLQPTVSGKPADVAAALRLAVRSERECVQPAPVVLPPVPGRRSSSGSPGSRRRWPWRLRWGV